MKKLLFTLIIVVFTSMATASIYYDTGLSYTIGGTNPNDGTIYLGSNINDYITLDYHTVNSPGTHLELVDGGSAYYVNAYGYSSVTISGGSIEQSLEMRGINSVIINNGSVGGVWIGDDSTLQIYDGTISYGIESMGNSTTIINGGAIGSNVEAWGESTIEIHGGTIDQRLMALTDGTIYLYGSDFSVGGQELGLGDNLRNYGTINGNEISGTITGRLQDGSVLNNTFSIYGLDTAANIIIVPEPATLSMMCLGILLLKKKRSS